jgi:AcrR family transcriptional regulator
MPRVPGAVRDRILAAAQSEFACYGFAGARIERIAGKARTSKERLYAHFRTKEHLHAAVRERHFARMDAAVQLSADTIGGFVTRYFDYYESHPDDMRLMLWSALRHAGEANPPANPQVLRLHKKIFADISKAQKAGRIDSTWDPAHLLSLLIAISFAWFIAPPPIKSLAKRGGEGHRAAMAEAGERLISPVRPRATAGRMAARNE